MVVLINAHNGGFLAVAVQLRNRDQLSSTAFRKTGEKKTIRRSLLIAFKIIVEFHQDRRTI